MERKDRKPVSIEEAKKCWNTSRHLLSVATLHATRGKTREWSVKRDVPVLEVGNYTFWFYRMENNSFFSKEPGVVYMSIVEE